jgi:UDP-N-acetylmuramate--alanine ligase
MAAGALTLPKRGRIHFIGIGGAGMSAIAKVLKERGHEVSGTDKRESRGTVALSHMGVGVSIGHNPTLVDGAAAVVYSSAIKADNPELIAARRAGVVVLHRGEVLASLLSGSRSIVVAGTHGKTTTSSMILSILNSANLNPTYVIGGALEDDPINAGNGGDDIAIAESDESDGSFLLLDPSIAVITNIEPDHLDHWGSLQAIEEAFQRFIGTADCAVVRSDDKVARLAAERNGIRLLAYGDDGEISAGEVSLEAYSTTFVLMTSGTRALIHLGVPGRHNLLNALAAAAACLYLGVDIEVIAAGLESFTGVERRYQLRGYKRNITVIDDYAHHPTEIAATLSAARLGRWRRVIAVFQPHLFSRTRALRAEFGAAFGDADVVVITDVYAAREDPVAGVTGKTISDAVCTRMFGRPVAYLPERKELLSYLVARARPGDLVLTLGAGDITTLADELLDALDVEAA